MSHFLPSLLPYFPSISHLICPNYPPLCHPYFTISFSLKVFSLIPTPGPFLVTWILQVLQNNIQIKNKFPALLQAFTISFAVWLHGVDTYMVILLHTHHPLSTIPSSLPLFLCDSVLSHRTSLYPGLHSLHICLGSRVGNSLKEQNKHLIKMI